MVTFTEQQARDHEQRLAKNRDKGLPQSPIAKPPVCAQPLGKEKGKTHDPDRFRVCITSVRARLTDPDNLVGKFFTDCLRYSGILKNDTAEDIDYTINQRKAVKGEEPHTLITIERTP